MHGDTETSMKVAERFVCVLRQEHLTHDDWGCSLEPSVAAAPGHVDHILAERKRHAMLVERQVGTR
jgi:hypothetical protein